MVQITGPFSAARNCLIKVVTRRNRISTGRRRRRSRPRRDIDPSPSPPSTPRHSDAALTTVSFASSCCPRPGVDPICSLCLRATFACSSAFLVSCLAFSRGCHSLWPGEVNCCCPFDALGRMILALQISTHSPCDRMSCIVVGSANTMQRETVFERAQRACGLGQAG